MPTPSDNTDQPAGKWIVIAHFPDEITAHLVSSQLDAEGIRCNLRNQLYSFKGTHPTTMTVWSDDLADAIVIVKKSPAARWLLVK